MVESHKNIEVKNYYLSETKKHDDGIITVNSSEWNDALSCDIKRQNDAILHRCSESREKIIQMQKDAALRRRKQQLQSGFITSINSQSRNSLDLGPQVVPTVKTYNSMSKIILPHGSESSLSESFRNENVLFRKASDEFRPVNSQFKYKEPSDQILGNVIETNTTKRKPHLNTSTRRQIERSPSDVSSLSHGRWEMDKINGMKDIYVADNDAKMIVPINIDDERSSESNSSNDEGKQSTDTIVNDNVSLWESIDWDNLQEVKQIVMVPCPKQVGMVKCYIRRYKGKSKLFPEYRLYLQDGDRFLMTSKKRAKKTSSNYLVSVQRNDYSKSSKNIIGKLRANFLGTEFQIYDNGRNPRHVDPFFDEKNDDVARSELGAILYNSKILGNRRPRKMQVCITRADSTGKTTRSWQPACRDEEMIENFKHNTDIAKRHLHMYENRQPKWNEDMGSYVLNFNKRVSLASVKNFQLIDPNNEEDVVLQFGKSTSDEFIMDVKWPMSLFQAFAISLSSFDSKIACD